MTSMTRQYSSATSRERSAVDKTADFWTQGAGFDVTLGGIPAGRALRLWC